MFSTSFVFHHIPPFLLQDSLPSNLMSHLSYLVILSCLQGKVCQPNPSHHHPEYSSSCIQKIQVRYGHLCVLSLSCPHLQILLLHEPCALCLLLRDDLFLL